LFFLSAGIVSGQERLLSVVEERDLTIAQEIDSVVCEFGLDIRPKDASRIFGLLRKFGRKNHCVSVLYTTRNPKGREVVASGLIAYPANRRSFRGVVELSPYNREKGLAGTKRMYTTEILIANLGYIVLVPDTIGYGVTEELPIPYVETDNAVQVSADLRDAAAEYFAQRGIKFPKQTYLFGYSLGASTALGLAYFYQDHPEYGARVKGVCLGSGAYDPETVLEHSLECGRINYLIYPGFVRGLNVWQDAGLDESKIFCGPVLEDYMLISSGLLNSKDLVEQYGNDVHAYLHPDFFTPAANPDILRLKRLLSESAYPFGHERLPLSVNVVIRHSLVDDIVPAACSQELFDCLKGGLRDVFYHRDRKGTHYEVAVRSFMDLALMLL